MSTITTTVLSTSATVFDREGYIQQRGVTVVDCGDSIGIGATEHLKSDLTITEDRIVSVHGWEVQL